VHGFNPRTYKVISCFFTVCFNIQLVPLRHGVKLLTELVGPGSDEIRPKLVAQLDRLLDSLSNRVWPLRSKPGLGLDDTVERIRHTRHVLATCAAPGWGCTSRMQLTHSLKAPGFNH
jgi:hypothetical protein